MAQIHIYLAHDEDDGSLDRKINVVLSGLYDNNLHKTANLK